jgi:hypothetical protein
MPFVAVVSPAFRLPNVMFHFYNIVVIVISLDVSQA